MDFEMIGKLTMSKDTEKFHPWEEKKFESGWVNRQIKFNAICGDNRHMLTVKGGSFADGHGDVYTYSKATVDENGNRKKGESIAIPFKDRLTSPKIAEVAEWKKFVFDTEKPRRRFKLEKALENVRAGANLTDEEVKELEIEDGSEATLKEALEKSKKKHREFISEWDFAEHIKKIIDSGKYADKKFVIKGVCEYTYSDEKERMYETMIPKRIYLAADEVETKAEATITMLINQDCFDDMSVEDKGRYYISGYMMERDKNRSANIPVPVTIALVAPSENADEKEKKRIDVIKNRFTVEDDSWKEIGVIVDMINGAQRTEITEDMLTDEQKEDLEYGLITMEDIRAELGGNVYGERMQEYRFQKIARGYSNGKKDTVYTDDDMVIKPMEDKTEEVVNSIFDDDDDDL